MNGLISGNLSVKLAGCGDKVDAGDCTSGAGKEKTVGRGVIGVGRELGEWKCSPSVLTPVIAGFIEF